MADTRVDRDLLNAAVTAYEAQKTFDPDQNAISAALGASLARFEQRVQERIARMLFARAEALGDDTEGGLALLETGNTLMETLPVEDNLEPEDGDLVEVSIVGLLTMNIDECSNCGHCDGSRTWSVTDRYTEEEFFFEDTELSNAKVRVISREGELPVEV